MKVQPRIYMKTKYNDKLSESQEAVAHTVPLVGICPLTAMRTTLKPPSAPFPDSGRGQTLESVSAISTRASLPEVPQVHMGAGR